MGNTALTIAAKNGNTDIVRQLLEKNANPNAANNEGDTALSLAQKRGHTEVVQILRDAGVMK